MGSSAALNVAAVRAGSHALVILERMLAAVHMACGPLLHLLGVMARIVDILVAELAFHGSLLFGVNRRPT
jgi:hypothetical protein